MAGTIRVGIGGWNFEPWRGVFYPEGLSQKRELEYAGQKLTTIEINATFYGSQKPASFARWREETPESFVFSVKGTRYATNRRVLAEAGPSIERFFASGVMELKEKLGPINWQMAPTKRFERRRFRSVPETSAEERGRSRGPPGGRGPSRELSGTGIRRAPARLRRRRRRDRQREISRTSPTSRRPSSMRACNARRRTSRPATRRPSSMPGRNGRANGRKAMSPRTCRGSAAPETKAPKSRDVFVYMINGFKPKAPAAAMALIERLG